MWELEYTKFVIILFKKSLTIPTGYSDAVNQKGQDYMSSMAKGIRTQRKI